jgi:hypothetical protein
LEEQDAAFVVERELRKEGLKRTALRARGPCPRRQAQREPSKSISMTRDVRVENAELKDGHLQVRHGYSDARSAAFSTPSSRFRLQLHHALIPRDHAPIDRLFEVTALSRDLRVGQLAHEGRRREFTVVLKHVEHVERHPRCKAERLTLAALAHARFEVHHGLEKGEQHRALRGLEGGRDLIIERLLQPRSFIAVLGGQVSLKRNEDALHVFRETRGAVRRSPSRATRNAKKTTRPEGTRDLALKAIGDRANDIAVQEIFGIL